jgi:uncharacterized protein with beta-barrel porin domain
MTDDFDQLADRLECVSPLMGAFNVVEHLHHQAVMRDEEQDVTSTDVVRRAWDQLSAEQQTKAMDVLFNAFYHQTHAVRKRLELESKAPEGGTYLEHGDLDIIDNTLSGAMALGGGESLDDLMPGGMLPIHIDLLQRLVSELELLQHRLAMKAER